MKRKNKSKNEFRFNKNTQHMNYVFEEDEKGFKSVGLTKHKKTFGITNMPLENNPQKNKKFNSYIRNGIIFNKKSSYSKHIDKNFEFSKNDFANVKSKIRKYKANRKIKNKHH